MTISVETFAADEWVSRAADRVTGVLPAHGSVVLTGGTTAQRLYAELAGRDGSWSGLQLFFSDERCVPPDHEASNYGMAKPLLDAREAAAVHRMRGEDDYVPAAHAYEDVIWKSSPDGFDLTLLGMGADAHIAALAPGCPALDSTLLTEWVYRTDGMLGITLTPRAIRASKKILLIIQGEGKANAVRRVLQGREPVSQCPARLLLDHPDVTMLLDEPAASAL